jgi:HlyD family secretion protein
MTFLQSKASRRFALWGFAVFIGALLLYRFKFAPLAVESVQVASGPIATEVLGTGTLEARVKTVISPQIQERLVEVCVDLNDSVKAGQLLARLDDGELKQQAEISAAALAAAKATAERVRADESRAKAVVQQARLQHQRAVDLLRTKVSSQSDLDKAVEQLDVAEAELKRAQAANTESSLQVITAEKTLLYHQERLGYARILSPYDGLIVRRDRDPGGVVMPGGSLLQLIATSEIWVSAWVDETALVGLAPGQAARVVFRSEPVKNYPGEVVRLGRETDRETREFLVDVRVKELPRNWAVGQRAEVYIEANRKASALVIPQAFVHWRMGQPGVFINRGGRAQWQEIVLGMRGRDAVEVLKGVTAGDQVVKPIAPKTELSSDQRISIQ